MNYVTRIAFSGCRDGNVSRAKLDHIIARFLAVEVHVGDCPTGIDYMVLRWAKAQKLPVVTYEADWDAHGLSAGPRRNKELVKGTDRLVAFWDGTSRGTLSAIREATRAGVPVEVYPL